MGCVCVRMYTYVRTRKCLCACTAVHVCVCSPWDGQGVQSWYILLLHSLPCVCVCACVCVLPLSYMCAAGHAPATSLLRVLACAFCEGVGVSRAVHHCWPPVGCCQRAACPAQPGWGVPSWHVAQAAGHPLHSSALWGSAKVAAAAHRSLWAPLDPSCPPPACLPWLCCACRCQAEQGLPAPEGHPVPASLRVLSQLVQGD